MLDDPPGRFSSNTSDPPPETTPRRSQRLQSQRPTRVNQATQTPPLRYVSVSTQTPHYRQRSHLSETPRNRATRISTPRSEPRSCGSTSRSHENVSTALRRESDLSKPRDELEVTKKLFREDSNSSETTPKTARRRRTVSWGSLSEPRRLSQGRKPFDIEEFQKVSEGLKLIASNSSPRGRLMLESALGNKSSTGACSERTASPNIKATAGPGGFREHQEMLRPSCGYPAVLKGALKCFELSVAPTSRSAQMLEAALKVKPPGILNSVGSLPALARKPPNGIAKRVTFK